MNLKYFIVFLIILLSVTNINAISVVDQLQMNLTQQEKNDLALALNPIAKLIAMMQYVAGIVIVIGIIFAGFTYFKSDSLSKLKSLQIIGALMVGSILIFGATTIAKVLGLV